MTQTEAFKRILAYWVDFRADGDWDPDPQALTDLIPEGRAGTGIDIPMIVWFGEKAPDSDTLQVFINKYRDWFFAVRAKWVDIMIGETTMEEVIFEQVLKETWL